MNQPTTPHLTIDISIGEEPARFINFERLEKDGELYYRLHWENGQSFHMAYNDDLCRLTIIDEAPEEAISREEYLYHLLDAYANGFTD